MAALLALAVCGLDVQAQTAPTPPAASRQQSQTERAQALAAQGVEAYRRNQYDEAVKLYTQSMTHRNDLAYVHYNRGLAHAALRNHEAARNDFTSALKINPKDASAYLQRADTWRVQKNFDEAMADVERALAIEPANAAVVIKRGDIFLDRQDNQRADSEYTRAIALDPKNAYALYSRGFVRRWRLQNEDSALEDFTRAIELNANYQSALIERAGLLVRRNDFTGAVVDYERLIKLNPRHGGYRNGRAWFLFKNGEAAKGLGDANMAVQLDPRSANFLDTRAHIHEAMGNHVAALADFRAALKFDPRLRESQAGLRRLERRGSGPQDASSEPRPAEEVYGRNFMRSGRPDPSLPQAQ